MLAFLTVIGGFRFKRLPCGIHSSNEVFQKTVWSIICDIYVSEKSQDDIVYGEKPLQSMAIISKRSYSKLERVVRNLIKVNVSFSKNFLYFWNI